MHQVDPERLGEATKIFKGDSLLALERRQLMTPQQLRDAKRLFRLAVLPLLGGEPLRSWQLFSKPKELLSC